MFEVKPIAAWAAGNGQKGGLVVNRSGAQPPEGFGSDKSLFNYQIRLIG